MPATCLANDSHYNALAVEFAALCWINWFNNLRLPEPLANPEAVHN